MENNFTGSSRMRVGCVQDLGLGMDSILHPFGKQYLRTLGLMSTPRGNGEQAGAGRTAKVRQNTSRLDNGPILGSSSLVSALRTRVSPSPRGLSGSSSICTPGENRMKNRGKTEVFPSWGGVSLTSSIGLYNHEVHAESMERQGIAG